LSSEARKWFAEKGFNTEFGARSVYRLVQKELKDKLAEQILFGELKNGGEAKVEVLDEKLVFSFSPRKIQNKKDKVSLGES